MSLRRALALAAATVLTLAACSTAPDDPPEPTTPQARTSLPAQATTVLATTGSPAQLAVAASQALFVHAPVVSLASEDNLAGQQAAAGLAERVSAPLLLAPSGAVGAGTTAAPGAGETPGPTAEAEATTDAGATAEAVRAELARLAPVAVVAFDDAAARWAATAAPAATPGEPAIVPAGEPLPPTEPAAPLTSLLVLTSERDQPDRTLAATITARASGARLITLADTDPRADPAAIEALAGRPIEQVLAIGEGFDPPERLRNRLVVAATGVQLPGGGQLVFPGRRMVALYGHPGAPVLGVLGEQSLAETVQRAQQTAAEYEELVDEPVVPVFEIITTLASGSPGPAGDYSLRTPVEQLRPWVEAAAEAGIYVVLDLQPGRTDFLSQAKLYEELLAEPHVGLALDPEWRLRPDQVHLAQIGSVSAAEVNEVVEWLAELTRSHRLPQKLLVLHQFRLAMITDRGQVDTSHDELAVLIHADGHGNPGQKLATWRALRADPPAGVWWGWKNFYDEDQPTFSPKETVAVDPSPRFISYQ
jgi:hypothetical protein